jgi:hypothetical protein
MVRQNIWKWNMWQRLLNLMADRKQKDRKGLVIDSLMDSSPVTYFLQLGPIS